jgi:F-type H+-transporting ATPase subunit b
MEESLLHNPTFWVAIAFLMFVAGSFKKISAMLLSALDGRAAKISAELEHARTLRVQAEQVLAEYKKKQAEYLKEAEAMLVKARNDADALTKQSEKELKESLDARVKQAMEKIAREEEQAIVEVRNHVVDIALSAARAVIVSHVGKLSQEELVKLAMVDIERKIH